MRSAAVQAAGLAGLASLLGCSDVVGRQPGEGVGRESDVDAGDLGAKPDASAPGAADGGPDVPLGDFGAPQRIAELGGAGEDDDPSLTADLLELYFNSRRTGSTGEDIWVSVRASTSAPWGAPTRVALLASAVEDSEPEVSGDGLTILFTSDRPGGEGDLDIWMSTRASRTAQWSPPSHVPELSSPDLDAAAQMTPDGLTVVLNSDRDNGNNALYVATRASTAAAWSTPVRIDELEDPQDGENNPFLTADRLTIYFNADRDNPSDDLYVATRASADAAFGPEVPLANVNSGDGDSDPWLSPDGRTLFFASARDGDPDLFFATR